METHTTNYFNTFIEVADDCPAEEGIVPPTKNGEPTIASLQFDILSQNPYKFTSDDVLFQVFADRNDIAECDRAQARKVFYSKGQACFRSSPLGKRYGWGVHANDEAKIAIYGMETEEYQALVENPAITCVKAMRSKRT
jgi:hypothetical protein